LPSTTAIDCASIRNAPQILFHYSPNVELGLDGLTERVRHFW
jgi:hypothetical protein